MSRPDLVQGNLKERQELDAEEMTYRMKALALHLGAGKVRIARLNQDWVYACGRKGEPVELDYKYAICMAFPHDPFLLAPRGASMSFEIGWRYAYSSYISIIVANYIRNLGWPSRALPQGNSPYFVGPTFIDAGIGEHGRCGFIVTKEFGNDWRPGAVATDLPLIPDKPVDFGLQDFCRKCLICAETCPPKAIPTGGKDIVRGVKKWQIDIEKCYTYAISVGGTCGICHIVCPWNHPNNLLHNTIRELAEKLAFLRGLIIRGEEIFYPWKDGKPLPKWMRDSLPLSST